jgi:uncharacterized Tic20 family protein
MTDTNMTPQTPDERVMAALAHISVLLPMIGVLAPIVIWVTQREKSKYVALQSLQALVFQIAMIVIWLFGMACYMCSFLGMFLPVIFVSSSGNSQSGDLIYGLTPLIPFLVLGLIVLVEFGFIVYGIVAAVMTFQGKPFRYVIIGTRVERFIQQGQVVVTNRS